jgi:uncharacterized integral membrane protein
MRAVEALTLLAATVLQERRVAPSKPSASMSGGDWNSPLVLVLLGALLVVVGLILTRLARAARARRPRGSR